MEHDSTHTRLSTAPRHGIVATRQMNKMRIDLPPLPHRHCGLPLPIERPRDRRAVGKARRGGRRPTRRSVHPGQTTRRPRRRANQPRSDHEWSTRCPSLSPAAPGAASDRLHHSLSDVPAAAASFRNTACSRGELCESPVPCRRTEFAIPLGAGWSPLQAARHIPAVEGEVAGRVPHAIG
jgi:hypothetical protein